MIKKINWFKPNVGRVEYKYVKKVIESNYPNQGVFTKKFEKKISKILNVKYVVAVPSGTVAIYLALKALGIGKGDRVVVPNITFVATANAVEMTGAKVVLVDVDKKNLGISLDALKKIKNNNKIKAIIPVHISGRGSNIREIVRYAKKKNIKIVEDAAEAFFSKNEIFFGTFGQIGCFSFSPNKIITTGQGGAIITNDKYIYKNLLKLKDQGRIGNVTGGGEDKIISTGYNFKFTNILSAIGLAQLRLLKKRKKILTNIYKIYRDNLNTSDHFRIFNFDLNKGELPLWTDVYSNNRDYIIKKLNKMGIECRQFWKPLNLLPAYKKSFKNFPNSKYFLDKLFWLPSNFEIKKKDALKICDEINKLNVSK